MLAVKGGKTLPGWRDFERAVAAGFDGENQENKFIFDVLVSDPIKPIKYGISCKMRGELDRVKRDGKVTIELSNSVKKFTDYLNSKGIQFPDYRSRPADVGTNLIDLVEQWKASVSTIHGGMIDLSKSSYLVLLYNKSGLYQLYWYDIELPDPRRIHWYYPEIVSKTGVRKIAGHLNGDDSDDGRLFEWYSDSGGQLKYYPLASSAKWRSEPFSLEPPHGDLGKFGLLAKAQTYFPDKWANLTLPKLDTD